MIKKIIIISVCFILTFLCIYPFVEIRKDNKIIKFSYSMDISEFEENACYGENYFYNEKRNISIYNFDFNNFLFFHMIVMEFKEGNVCDTEYLLEEAYIENFLENAEIKYNNKNIDLGKLIKNKKAIVANKRYFDNPYDTQIDYILDDRHETLYVFYVEDLLVIQVGLSDEGPKFIAYK